MKSELRILFICGTYFPEGCGVGDYTCHLANELAKLKITVGALTSSYTGVKPAKNPVRVMPEIKNWDLPGLKAIIGKIEAFNPGIAHIQYPSAEYKKHLAFNFLPRALKKSAPHIKIIETFHEPIRELGLLGKIRLLQNFSQADGRIFVEKENQETLPLMFRLFAGNKPSAVIGVAPNIPKATANISGRLRKKFKIPKNKKLMVTFGYINRIKGFDLLLEAFDPEKEEWLHIGKPDKNYPYQVKFLKTAKESGKSGHMHFTGRLHEKEVAATLASADVCAFPFRGGVTARHATYLSAVLQGTYAIAAHKSKTRYDKTMNTLYVPAGSAGSLRRALDEKPRRSRAKTPVISWKDIAEKHKQFYSNII